MLDDCLTPLLEDLPKDITKLQREVIHRLLCNYNDLFVRSDEDLGHTTLVEQTIDTGDNHPCKQPPRRLPLAQGDIADLHVEVDKLLVRGLIEPCDSPWASPIVLVTKKDGSTRFCIDYRRLNNVTGKDAFPIPCIDENFEALSGAEWFSTLDMASRYWQVLVAEQDRHKTAFCTRKGLFQWRVLPFGLSNAPSTFSRLMELVLRGILWERCLVYLDDIIIFGRDFESALENLRHVFDRLRRAGLKLKAKKCKLFQKTVKFLGHVVSKKGVQCDPEKVECVQNWKVPECMIEVRSFLGLASYYRRFIPQYAADPLTRLTEKGRKFTWNDQCQQAFETLKQKLVTAPVLAYPQTEGLMVLDTDASAVSISGCVSQIQNGEERVIAYGSKALSAAQRRYCTTKRELLAVVKFVKYYRTYLWGRHFMVRTDHASLRWLLNFKDPEGMLARWLSVLDTYDFEIVHRPGAKHNNADSLTRQNCTQCKRHQCGGATVTEREMRILRQHEDRLDANQEQDVQEDGVFLALPVTVGEQETFDEDGTNWFFTWNHDELVRMQEEEPAISKAIQWKTNRAKNHHGMRSPMKEVT